MSDEITFPSLFDFCFNHSLYEEIDFSGEGGIKAYYDWLRFGDRLDGYCADCGQSTIFTMYEPMSAELRHIFDKNNEIPDEFEDARTESTLDRNLIFDLTFLCTRNPSHQVIFYLKQHDHKVQKIGQFPSLADVKIGELSHYQSVLSGQDKAEFNKALGLAAHDVGAGAFLYLRRVLERLVNHRQDLAIESGAKKPEDFEGKRFAKRIKELDEHLPEMLAYNTLLYGVLSKGVHTLSEEECLMWFPVVRDLMFLILEEDMEKKSKDQLKAQSAASMKKIQMQLAESKD